MENQLLPFPVVLISILFVFLILKLWSKSKPKSATPKLPPGPKKLPLIGNMHQLVGSLPHHRLRDLAKEYGGIMHLQLGEVSNVVISTPEMAKEVMKTHDLHFAQRPSLLAASIITHNCSDIAFSPYGEYWRQLRKICMLELLSAKRVQSFRSIREEEVSKLVSTFLSSAGKPINFSRMIISSTYTIAARATFGKKCKDQDVFIPLVEEITRIGSGFSLADLFPSKKFLQVISGMGSTLQRLSKEADRIIGNIIDDHRVKNDAAKICDKDVGDDLIDVLLKVHDGGNHEFQLTIDNIKAVVLDIFIAGSETSSTTVEWAMSEMLKSPRVMKKAQDEVRKVFKEKGNVDETGLHELNYLKLIIKETLRLHSPVPLLLPRECREKCVINGYEIPRKTKVIVNAWAIGRDPEYWTEPESFFPERFLDSSIDYKGTNFEYIPFGAGRRMCPGILFGMANVELPLAQLLYHFDWQLTNQLKPEALDMTESFGATVRRKSDLHLIPIPYHPVP